MDAKKSTWVLAIVGVLLLCGVGVVVRLGWIPNRFAKKSPIATEGDRIADLREKDLKSLSQTGVPDGIYYSALIRLAQMKDLVAKQEAIKKSTSQSVILRRAAAQALGYFDDEESLNASIELLKDSDFLIRSAVLNGFGQGQGEKREKLLHEISKRKNLKSSERHMILASLIKVTPTQQKKDTYTHQLIDELEEEKDPIEVMRTCVQLMGMRSRDQRLLELLRKVVQKEKTLDFVMVAIRHLATVGDSWLKEQFTKLLDSSEPKVRITLIQVMHFACPAQRWTLLDHVIDSDRDRTVVDSALQEIPLMPGPDAKALLDRKIASNTLGGIEKELAKKLRAGMATSTAVDPCNR